MRSVVDRRAMGSEGEPAVTRLDRILRLPELQQTTGVSRATLYRWIEAGQFPPPVQLGPNSVGWRASAVQVWIERLPPAGSEPTR